MLASTKSTIDAVRVAKHDLTGRSDTGAAQISAHNPFTEYTLHNLEATIQQYQHQVVVLSSKARDAADLVSYHHHWCPTKADCSWIGNLLDLENGNALRSLAQASREENVVMLKLSEKATKDAAAVKILTVTTLVYLPVAVVLVCKMYETGGETMLMLSRTSSLRTLLGRKTSLRAASHSQWPQIGGSSW